MFDIRPLLHVNFWFDTTPVAILPANERVIFAIFAILLVVGAIIRMVGAHRKEDRHVTEVFNRIGRMCVTMGFLGLVLFFFSYQRIPFFSARFWYMIWGVLLLVWIGGIVHYAVKIIPQERQHEIEAKERRKYLPKRKSS